MMHVSEAAMSKIVELLGNGGDGATGVRVWVQERTAEGAVLALDLARRGADGAAESVATIRGVAFFVPTGDLADVRGAFLDYVESAELRGFCICPPSPLWDDARARKTQEVLDRHVNPIVSVHGGQVELADLKGNVAFVRMRGGCHGCSLANTTLRGVVEKAIRQHVGESTHVVDITNHSTGNMPYYRR